MTTPLPLAEEARLRALVTEGLAVTLLRRMRATLGTSKSEFNAYMLAKSPKAREHFLPLLQEMIVYLQWPADFVEWEATLAPKPKKKPNAYKSYREIWVQEHLWVLLLGFLRSEYEVPHSMSRVWAQAGFTRGRTHTEQVSGCSMHARLT